MTSAKTQIRIHLFRCRKIKHYILVFFFNCSHKYIYKCFIFMNGISNFKSMNLSCLLIYIMLIYINR